ncbi:ParB/RepB/Spo0J family partition protein [Oxalobacteraceae bacterium A2-2]
MDAPLPAEPGAPLQLPLDAIDEDPRQPRGPDNPGFAPDSLAELADAIRRRGVKTPISVRLHPGQPGRYLINHGARRYRASRLAGRRFIPAFIDNDYHEADQVVENLQRNELTAREIADYIGRELARGLRRKEIAQRISKSAAYVTQHAVLLDLPDPIAAAFNTARVRDVTLVNELVQAYKADAQVVDSWLAEPAQEITRGTVRLLREFLTVQANITAGAGEAVERAGEDQPGQVEPMLRQRPFYGVLLALHAGKLCQLLLMRRPSRAALAWVRYADGADAEIPLAELDQLRWQEPLA